MNLEQFKEDYLKYTYVIDSKIELVDELELKDRIDDAVTIRNVYLELPNSITRTIKILIDNRVRLTDIEKSAINALLKVLHNDKISGYEYVIMNSIVRRLREDVLRENTSSLELEVDTLSREIELDRLLVINGFDCFHSTVKLFLLLIYSVGRSFRKG